MPSLLARPFIAAAAAVALLCASGAAVAAQHAPRPIRVLVFSKPYGFSHTASIVNGGKYLDGLDGTQYQVDNTTNPKLLVRSNLDHYDVLVWNNSTGEVPLSAADKADLIDWVRDGHGFVGIHSAGDSNYTWPQFSELVGGFFLMHWYRFGGLTPEPYHEKLVREDPNNPILAGVPDGYDSYDETYAWDVDPRPDVHVLMSVDNPSIYAEGALYSWHQPHTWCRPFGSGRTFYTNLGHDGALWSDPVFTRLIRNGISYAGGRLDANCDVPTDPVTGVAAKDRLEAIWAKYRGADLEVSTYSGGTAVLTKLQAGHTQVTYPAVTLSGVKSVDVFATAQTIAPIASTRPVQTRISPASGGTVEIHLDSARGRVLGTVTIPPAPGVLGFTNTPDDSATAAANQVASWSKLTTSIPAVSGKHSLVLTFSGGGAGGNYIGSLGWIHLTR